MEQSSFFQRPQKLSFFHHIYFSPNPFLSRILILLFQYQFKKAVLPLGTVAYYEYSGKPNAPTVILVHGIGVSAVHFYQLLIRFRLKGYRVLALDLPSHGESSDLSVPLNARYLYQTLSDWMDHHGCPRFILVGNSLGGLIALKYAFFHPSRVSHLIVNSPAGGFQDLEGWNQLKKKLLFNSLSETAHFLKMIYHSPPFYLPFMTLFFYLNMHRFGVLELIQSAGFKDFQVFRTEHSQKVPVLFVWGRSEKVLTDASLEWYKTHIGGPVEFDQPEQLGHCAHMERPAWFVERIEAFLKKYA